MANGEAQLIGTRRYSFLRRKGRGRVPLPPTGAAQQSSADIPPRARTHKGVVIRESFGLWKMRRS